MDVEIVDYDDCIAIMDAAIAELCSDAELAQIIEDLSNRPDSSFWELLIERHGEAKLISLGADI